jgi:hypothetical protein
MRRAIALIVALLCGACGTGSGSFQPSSSDVIYASHNLCAWYGHTPGTTSFGDCFNEAAEGYSLQLECQPKSYDLAEATRCSATYHRQVSRQQCLADILRSRGC